MKFLRRIIYYCYSIVGMLFGFKDFLKITRIFIGRKTGDLLNVQLKKYPVSFQLRGKMDLWALKETWLDKFYERHGIRIEDGWLVVDIGAGYGDFTIRASHNKPNSSVYAFEPFIESFRLLKKNIEINNKGQISAIPMAVWSKTGPLILDLTNGEPLQSPTLDHFDKSINSSQVKKVQAISLSDFMKEYQIPKVDLLKIDCEGAEYEILLGCAPETLSKIDRITMEYHDGFQGHNHKELATLLSAHNFEVVCVSNIVHNNLGYLYAIRKL